ncbi:MAG: class I SAM-dependent methyltransferase [Ignavibacteriales bacterium]|nr:class I SAM-dependent methyltransferase [Ignavibacteriales bacterium]
MPILQEELLEPLARYLRFREIIKYIDRKKNLDIIDVGAGPNTPFESFLNRNGYKIKSYIAIDPLIKMNKKEIKYINHPVVKKLLVKSNSKDYAIAAAFIEHINNPKEILHEMIRVIKPGGKVIITTPTPRAKNILEFLSHKLKLISRREIQEHKNYFNKKSLIKLLPENKAKQNTYHKYFELGLNNLLVIEKRL